MGKKGDKKKEQTRQRFTDEFRRKVCIEYLTGLISKVDLQRKYNLGGHSCVTKWLRRFGLEERTPSFIEQVTMPKDKRIKELVSKEGEHNELHQKIRELEAKNEALELMLQLAEDRFNIRIRKK